MKYLPILAAATLLAGCGLIQLSQPSAPRLAAHRGFNWHTDSTTHFTYYYEADSPAQDRLQLIKEDAEASFDHVRNLIGAPNEAPPLHLFAVSSRQRMEELIGRQTNGTAFPDQGVLIFIVSEDLRLGARHELLHVLAMNSWGEPEIWLNEGLAVYADDQWWGHDLHGLAHLLDGRGRLLPVADLLQRFRREDDLVTYPQAGSLVKYLYEQYGMEVVRTLWTQGHAVLKKATGRSLAELESDWLKVVRSADSSGVSYPR